MMFFCSTFLVVFMMNFLRDFRVSSCDATCADKPVFTPSRLVVKFGDPTAASCSVCERCIDNIFNLESPVGLTSINGTTMFWTIERLTEWLTSPICYYNTDTDVQCCTILPITVYQPPDNVSVSFVDHTGPMFEGKQYTLQCTVEEVAPVENLTVTFYRGQTALGQLQSKNNNPKPVTETFSLNITLSKEDNGVQYWCEAKLELGPYGPQLPPVETSQTITATVFYKPQLEGSLHPEPITVLEGEPLQLNCSALGNPGPSYTWTLPSGSPSTSSSSVLIINSATFADEGKYTCSVSNDVGTATVELNVEVRANNKGILIGVVTAALIAILILLIGLFYCYKSK
ncbi:vascular cell adhesion protein 1-like isoform X2 [Cyclopterus lumpus]|uniref:vascular cell adhesion protein 1-like isoform X2 n=1 Tax=Cyclopterus lumpus TaxID=8103 RepID=UPI001486375D|nr:vascular cell adhesion protein 1-like isoform X2 [Cyclopterus lumpus]